MTFYRDDKIPVIILTMKTLSIVPSRTGNNKKKKCLSCGKNEMAGRRRYCSDECRQQMLWVLSLAKGLLKVFNARYAAFSFSSRHVILDVLPVWSREISRFALERRSGKKPAEDLKKLILKSGQDWYNIIENRNSRSYASLFLLKKNHTNVIPPSTIKPNRMLRPRFSKHERQAMEQLKLKMEELFSEGKTEKIKTAYKRMAKIHHPDMGGDAEKFKRLNEAHQQMLVWAENPQFTSRKALDDCWSYDGSTNKWTPPL